MTDNFWSEKFPKRVWVKTRDLVTFQDKYSKAKACELGRDTKKYKQEDVDKAMNQVQLGHEEAGRAETANDRLEMAVSMVKSRSDGGGGCFQSANMALCGVRDLLPVTDDGEEAEAEVEEAEAADEEEEDACSMRSAGASSKTLKKQGGGKWFDRDRAVTTAERLARQTLHKLKASVHSVVTEMVKWESHIKNLQRRLRTP